MTTPPLRRVTPEFLAQLRAAVGDEAVISDPDALVAYGVDGLTDRGHSPDVAVRPGSVTQVSAIARACNEHRVPLVPRGAGTGYSGGAVPILGGVVLSLERFNRILEIDVANLVAIVEPLVINAALRATVEAVGLFYPPDPASLDKSSIGGNVAECAGGPRAFKYGTTKRYVLGLEAVLPTGELIATGGRTVKNVAGYDLTSLLVGSEGTLAIITKIILRLVPKPPAAATLRATFPSIAAAATGVSAIVAERIEPAALELIDGESLRAIDEYLGRSLAPTGTQALLLIEVDGLQSSIDEQVIRVQAACRRAGALECSGAASEAERESLWRVRRELSPALRTIAPVKFNHDVVVPKGRVPELFDVVQRLRERFALRMPCFGHAGDGNIHVNIMVERDEEQIRRAHRAERELFEAVLALGGSISGEHGIGFTKARFLPMQFSADEIALMRRVKAAFDPNGILNPGKIF